MYCKETCAYCIRTTLPFKVAHQDTSVYSYSFSKHVRHTFEYSLTIWCVTSSGFVMKENTVFLITPNLSAGKTSRQEIARGDCGKKRTFGGWISLELNIHAPTEKGWCLFECRFVAFILVWIWYILPKLGKPGRYCYDSALSLFVVYINRSSLSFF